MPHIELTILIGQYAQAKFLGARRGPTLTDTVENWEKYAPVFFALPHAPFAAQSNLVETQSLVRTGRLA